MTAEIALTKKVHATMRETGFFRFYSAEKRYSARVVTRVTDGERGVLICPHYKQALLASVRKQRAFDALKAVERAGLKAHMDGDTLVFVPFDQTKEAGK